MTDAGAPAPLSPASNVHSDDLIAPLRDPKPGNRQRAVETLGRLASVASVAPLAELAKTEPNDNVRGAIASALGQIGDPTAQNALLEILKSDRKPFVRKLAAESLGHSKAPLLGVHFAELMSTEKDDDVRFSLATAASKLDGAVASQCLLGQLEREPSQSHERPYLIHLLGEIHATEAVDVLSRCLRDDETTNARVSAASALQAIQGKKAAPLFAEALAHESDASVRKRLATLLGKSGDGVAINQLTAAMVTDPAPEVRDSAAAALAQINESDRKQRTLLDVLKSDDSSRGELQPVQLVNAVSGNSAADRQAFADVLIKQAPDSNARMTGLLAELIIACCSGSVELAGMRLNAIAGDDEKYRPLRIEIGGALALNPVLQALYQNLQENFTAPIAKLNRRTERDWRKTIKAAHRAFTVRIVMSVVVFIVGILVLGSSAIQFLFGNVSGDRLWGTGVTFVGGLGAMLAVIYAGPLRDIRRSVNDLGAASAAFIGFIHRVLQTSHTYSFYYLKSVITFQETEQASELISRALADMRLSLEPGSEGRRDQDAVDTRALRRSAKGRGTVPEPARDAQDSANQH